MVTSPITKASRDSRRRKDLYKRIPVWNRLEERLIAGVEAPTRRNLIRYLTIYPFCEIYVGQERFARLHSMHCIIASLGLDPCERVMIWNRRTTQMIRGHKAPQRYQLAQFLMVNPDCEEFVPWEARVSKIVADARERWLLRVRGTSYMHGKVIPPTAFDGGRRPSDYNIDLTRKPIYPTF